MMRLLLLLLGLPPQITSQNFPLKLDTDDIAYYSRTYDIDGTCVRAGARAKARAHYKHSHTRARTC